METDIHKKIAYFLGVSIHQQLKSIANKLRSKESRDLKNLVQADDVILTNVLDCEILHSFLEGATKKKPRSDDEDCSKYGSLHIQAIECLLKCVNSKTVGIGSLKRNFESICKTPVSGLNPGGGRQVIRSLPVGEELPVRKGCGLLVGDNAQRGIKHIQKHNRLKYNRSEAAVSVQTHLVVYENSEDAESLLFKKTDMGPSSTDFHSLFRPVNVDFLAVFKIRLKIDEDVGHKVISVVMKQFLSDVIQDVKSSGNGVSSLSILQRLSETNSGELPKICVVCHYKQDYDPNSQNVCECGNNPTKYTGDSNPYLRFGLAHGTFKPVTSHEQESLNLNPSSYDSLTKLMDKIHSDQELKGDNISVIGLDGLPGIRIKRMQSDMVKCLTHEEIFKLSNVNKCEEHNNSSCEIGWVFGDKVVVLGESHEEIFLNLCAAGAASKFCLFDVLKELGKKSKQNQESAIKKKELNRLFQSFTFLPEGFIVGF